MMRKLPWAEILVTAVVLAAGVGVYLYAHRDEGRLEESKRHGVAIVNALETYRAEHGTYPEHLDELVPDYLPHVEPPTWGLGRWSYRRYTPSEMSGAANVGDDAVYFRISVAANESGYPVLYYDLPAARWVLNN